MIPKCWLVSLRYCNYNNPMLSSISFLSLDLIELAQFLFLSAFTQAGKVGGFFFSSPVASGGIELQDGVNFLHEIRFF